MLYFQKSSMSSQSRSDVTIWPWQSCHRLLNFFNLIIDFGKTFFANSWLGNFNEVNGCCNWSWLTIPRRFLSPLSEWCLVINHIFENFPDWSKSKQNQILHFGKHFLIFSHQSWESKSPIHFLCQSLWQFW